MNAAAVPSEIVQSQLPRLKITEIFLSLQGEAETAGWPTVFVRLTGCPLRCQYCDTAYAFHGGQWHDIDAIVADVASHGVRHVCVTGGEPLAQKRCLVLLQKLCDAGFDVSLETSGALDVSEVDARVSRVVDIKTPASGEAHRNRWDNLALLTARDQIKFVICSRADYDWSREIVAAHALDRRCTVWFSPSKSEVTPRQLADWIVADRVPVRFQMQLHKILWNDEPGR
ncbi:7-carboxy-7-deazaguanine synthase QueE [Xanthomonas cannabis]|uniref:7-carboxy-7-deazaguanine synthase QueE n=1 Tax=Xanthomonas cannabis TaxID=1885674 RepID=UPI0005759460|nr:7-carboxy-7-deazaguanine synthase QueE [Xanthomonas cannabis]KHL54771.1 7-carboxy-7-deazaguanine synthase [Xanthomonas cannabis pv. cannabis]KHL60168.1 7-carboxy-7-deazaguanine synthase [Xanthomonas cannabis pv. cannabis]MCC8442138.1 7-carboxy-7-deazaguanine synthase QueE [Xanthomonas cannabis]